MSTIDFMALATGRAVICLAVGALWIFALEAVA
jgi:hypothetical protein